MRLPAENQRAASDPGIIPLLDCRADAAHQPAQFAVTTGKDSTGASGDALFNRTYVASEHIAPAEDDLALMRRVAEASATAICAEAAEFETSVASVRHAISEADASRRLRLAVEVAASRDAIAMDALRIAVCEFTFALRSEGRTPEAVLIGLKQLIDDQVLPLIRAHPSDHAGHVLRATISTWCIKAYFDSEGACL